MAITAVAIVRLTSLVAVIILSGVFSLLGAMLYVALDAVDVAFTEAAVGAGVSTVLMIATLALTSRSMKVPSKTARIPLMIVTATGALLIYGSIDMPPFGDPTAPINNHVAPYYIEKSGAEVGPPNIVTSVLASYRGYDTLGETSVIFTAAAGVMVMIGRGRKRKKNKLAASSKPETKG